MAEINPPAWQENASNRARQARLIATALVSSGAWTTGDMVVTAPGGSMNISISAGGVYVPNSTAGHGSYACYNDAPVSRTLANGGGANRTDLIVARVRDTFYGDATNAWDVFVVDGTTGAPAVPATPANSYALARVAVNAGVTSITNVNITDVRSTAAFVRYGGYVAADLANFAVTPDKLLLNPAQQQIVTAEGTTSTSYVDLATVGPSATVTVGVKGQLLCIYNTRLGVSLTSGSALCAVSLSGANTYAGNDNDAIEANSAGSTTQLSSGAYVKLFTSLSSGSTTVRLKYRSTNAAATSTFARRSLVAIPL